MQLEAEQKKARGVLSFPRVCSGCWCCTRRPACGAWQSDDDLSSESDLDSDNEAFEAYRKQRIGLVRSNL